MIRISLMLILNFFRLPYMFILMMWRTNPKHNCSIEKKYKTIHQYVKWGNWAGRVKIKHSGIENLPKESGYVMFPNHQGLYDVLTLLDILEVPFSVVVKKESERIYMLKKVLQLVDAVYMDRNDIRQSLTVIQTMTARVKNGENFVIFSEGTRSKQGNKMGPFKPGSFKSAVMAKAPIVPVALIDCFLPFDSPSPFKSVTVQAHILEPIYYEEYKDLKTPEIAELVHSRIEAEIAKRTADRQ